ncbi:MAG: hypothetical protein ACE5KA_04525 [Nitrososphaerales archaeon]
MNGKGVMQMVFSSKSYIMIAMAGSAIFFIIFNVLDEYLFFSPIISFHVPSDAYPNFALSTSIVGMLGIVISMNVYMFRTVGVKFKESTPWLSGSFMAGVSGVCGCSYLGFAIISTFSGAGTMLSSFLTNYQIPLRIISLALLIFAYYSVRKNMIKSCAVKKQ